MGPQTKHVAICLIALMLYISALPGTVGEARKLLQSRDRDRNTGSNIAANTVRSQAATSQAITEAVNSGASFGATRRAGDTGRATSWAAGQPQNTFNAVEQFAWGGRTAPIGH